MLIVPDLYKRVGTCGAQQLAPELHCCYIRASLHIFPESKEEFVRRLDWSLALTLLPNRLTSEDRLKPVKRQSAFHLTLLGILVVVCPHIASAQTPPLP